MRIVLLAGLVLLSACGPGQFYSPERIAERQKLSDQQRAIEADIDARWRASASGNATLTCETKVAFAMAGNPIRGSLDVAGVVRQQQLQAACMDQWRRTGQFP